MQGSYPGVQRSSSDISVEEAEVLRNSRRRGVIKALSEEESMLESLAGLFLEQEEREVRDKSDVAEQVASWEMGERPEDIPRNKLKSVKTTLHQHHIPLLEEKGIIEYFREENLLRSVPETDEYAEMIGERPYPGDRFPGVEASEDNLLTADQGFEMLSNERRREALKYMEDYGGTLELSALADFIAERENPDSHVSASDRKAVYVGLSQCHLPRLDGADILDYDEDRKEMSKGRYFEEVTEFLPDNGEDPYGRPGRVKAMSFLPLF